MDLQEMISKYDAREGECLKNGFLNRDDWEALCRVIVKYDCKKIMEFGSGTSTRLFVDCGLDCVSYEQDKQFRDSVMKECPGAKVFLWDGITVPKGNYDLIFIDGPWNVPKTPFKNRRNAFLLTRAMSPKIVAMHDMHFKMELSLRRQIFGGWKQIDKSKLMHIVRNPKK